jgi:hypothetical protein
LGQFYQLSQRITQSATDRNRSTNRDIIIREFLTIFWCRIYRSTRLWNDKTWTALSKAIFLIRTRFRAKRSVSYWNCIDIIAFTIDFIFSWP